MYVECYVEVSSCECQADADNRKQSANESPLPSDLRTAIPSFQIDAVHVFSGFRWGATAEELQQKTTARNSAVLGGIRMPPRNQWTKYKYNCIDLVHEVLSLFLTRCVRTVLSSCSEPQGS